MCRPGLFVVTKAGRLAPASLRSQEDMRTLRLRPGDLVSVQIIRPRNPKLSALANAVLSKLAEGLGVPTETVKTRLKIALGYADLIEKPDGTIEQHARSLSFEDLPDEDTFIEFWKAAEQFVAELLPALEPADQREILTILEGRRAVA